jgi:glyoxylase-like metal-dependent hydrolase (beta-lactamase superfamily II)
MKLFFHYCPFSFSNCYVLGSDKGEQNVAIIIDPGTMDDQILNIIEKNNYQLKAVLLTHDHDNHTYGLHALRRIYDFEVYSAKSSVLDIKTTMLRDEDEFDIGQYHFEVISVPGHSTDSLVYKTGNVLFSGDALTAGMVGATFSSYGAMAQAAALQNKVLTLPGNCFVFPGHGPPSSLEVERHFNAGLKHFEENRHRNRHPAATFEFLE